MFVVMAGVALCTPQQLTFCEAVLPFCNHLLRITVMDTHCTCGINDSSFTCLAKRSLLDVAKEPFFSREQH
jgi:hypothetical protein